jgi:hypothetical protein
MDSYHVAHDSRYDAWCVTRDGKTIECFNTKDHAISLGRELARDSILAQLTVHAPDGLIEDEWIYGAEPIGY